jgi:hypothetical protein
MLACRFEIHSDPSMCSAQDTQPYTNRDRDGAAEGRMGPGSAARATVLGWGNCTTSNSRQRRPIKLPIKHACIGHSLDRARASSMSCPVLSVLHQPADVGIHIPTTARRASCGWSAGEGLKRSVPSNRASRNHGPQDHSRCNSPFEPERQPPSPAEDVAIPPSCGHRLAVRNNSCISCNVAAVGQGS